MNKNSKIAKGLARLTSGMYNQIRETHTHTHMNTYTYVHMNKIETNIMTPEVSLALVMNSSTYVIILLYK